MIINYKGNEIDIQTGDIVLRYSKWEWYNPMRYLSVLIRFFTGNGILTPAKVNHAEVIISDWFTPMLNEASWTIICRPASQWLEKWQTRIIILTPTGQIDEEAFAKKANQKLGASYWIAGLFWQLLYRITGKWLGPIQNTKMFCTFYAAWCHGRPDPWKYSCKELLNDSYFKVKFEE